MDLFILNLSSILSNLVSILLEEIGKKKVHEAASLLYAHTTHL